MDTTHIFQFLMILLRIWIFYPKMANFEINQLGIMADLLI